MNNTKCWQGFRATKLMHFDGRECKLLCEKIQQFLMKLTIGLPY